VHSRMLCSSSTIGTSKMDSDSALFHTRISMDKDKFEDDNDHRHLDNYGLLITLDPETGACQMSLTPDAHYEKIHPNAYAPKNLTQMHRLGGGGSGVAVFEGHHPTLGDIVMKHGGEKDMKELFALAEISQELQARGTSNPAAAQHLKERIPEFKMIYVSPNHLGEKRRELWHRLAHMYKYSSRNLLLLTKEDELQDSFSHSISHRDSHNALEPLTEEKEEEEEDVPVLKQQGANHHRARRAMMSHIPKIPSRSGLNMTQSGTVSGHRDITLYSCRGDDKEEPKCSIELLGDSLTVSIPYCPPEKKCESKDNGEEEEELGIQPITLAGDGYQNLTALVKDLVSLMREHKWKFTLGQKRIGGDHPTTGNLWLYAGKLDGKLLENLITENIQLVRDLASLTTSKERDPAIILEMQKEVVRIEEEDGVEQGDISQMFDAYVGMSVRKNFEPEKGRFPVLSQLGRQFREASLHSLNEQVKSSMNNSDHSSRGSRDDLTKLDKKQDDNENDLVLVPEEEIPAFHLGCLIHAGSLMGDTFENAPLEPSSLEMHRFYWVNILRAAIQPRRQNLMDKTSTMAMTRIWSKYPTVFPSCVVLELSKI